MFARSMLRSLAARIRRSWGLTLFGGGDREAFEATEAIFSAIAKQWFYMGPSGSGVAMKLVVNGLLGVGMQAIAEAAALGSRLGLPRDLLLDTLAKTAVVAPAHAGKLATAKKNDYTPQFPIRLMHKDFGLILTVAARVWTLDARDRGGCRNEFRRSGFRDRGRFFRRHPADGTSGWNAEHSTARGVGIGEPMIRDLFSTNPDWSITIIRIILGVVFFAHGAQKLFGWFGGQGLKETVRTMHDFLGLPLPLALAAVATEFLGGLGLILGLLSRVAALGIGVTMLAAIVMVHGRNGLFMDWFGAGKTTVMNFICWLSRWPSSWWQRAPAHYRWIAFCLDGTS